MGLLDADITGPNIPLMMGIEGAPRASPEGKIRPLERYGVKVISIQFFVPEGQPIVWRGPLVGRRHPAVPARRRLGRARLPGHRPAAGHLGRAADARPVGAHQRRAAGDHAPGRGPRSTWRRRSRCSGACRVPVIGIVENMSAFVCPHCGEATEIFGRGGGERFAARHELEFFGGIPLDVKVRQGGDAGIPAVAQREPGRRGGALRALARPGGGTDERARRAAGAGPDHQLTRDLRRSSGSAANPGPRSQAACRFRTVLVHHAARSRRRQHRQHPVRRAPIEHRPRDADQPAVAGADGVAPSPSAPARRLQSVNRERSHDPMRLRSGVIRSIAAIALAGVVASLAPASRSRRPPRPLRRCGRRPAQLTITTTYPSVVVDPGGDATFPLLVASAQRGARRPLASRARPRASRPPSGAAGSSSAASTRGGERAARRWSCASTVPEGAAPGTTKLTVHGAAAERPGELPVDLVVADISGGAVTLTSDFPACGAIHARPSTFNLRLANDTAQEHDLHVSRARARTAGPSTCSPAARTQAASVGRRRR